MTRSNHIPVLLHETLNYLRCERGKRYLDCTLGSGGHSLEIARRICPEGLLVGIDRDAEALERAKGVLDAFGNCIHLVQGNFADMDVLAEGLAEEGFDGIIMDLGFSSPQVDDPNRGFSFSASGPLDMRMDRSRELTAEKILNTWSGDHIAAILRDYGEERYWKRIVRGIENARKIRPISSTGELTEIVLDALPPPARKQQIHPATRVFQALRIAVNDELEGLRIALPKAISLLRGSGRLAVISYHSLEDRIVKREFATQAKGCVCPPDFPVCTCGRKAAVKIITRKVAVPSREEVLRNPRSRSAKLRVAEKLQSE